MKDLYTSLDIGSSSIKLVVAEMYKGKLNVLACSEVKSKGIKNGLIVNAEEVLICLKEVFRRTEEVLQIKINKVLAIIPSYYSEFFLSEGYTTITREDKKINGSDIVRAMQSSAYNRVPDNRELVSICPIDFVIDDEENVVDPKGKEGEKLYVKTVISTVPKKNVYGIVTLLDNIGVDVVDIALSPTADYYEFRKKEYEDKTGAVINIGKDNTEVRIINKGILIATEIIPIGGKNIDKDISYIYNINMKDALYLKENFALASKRNASAREIETLVNEDNEEVKVNQYELSEIIYSRLKEILDLSKKQINLLTKKEISYIIITGGTTEISDFKVVFDNMFGRNYTYTEVKEIGVRNNKYSGVVGAIKFYYDKLKFKNHITSTIDEEEQKGLFTVKKNVNKDSVLGKVYGYFFDN